MALDRKDLRNLKTGLFFLLPNISGFAAFTILPLIASLLIAFSNWDIRHHNMFKDGIPELVGLANFTLLFSHKEFWRFLGNTMFLMIGIPFTIGGSLLAALLLTKNLRGKRASTRRRLLIGSVLVTGVLILFLLGFRLSGLWLLLGGLAGLVLIGGTLAGSTFYRTLFYTPHFTAGVATFLLWKKIYNAETGPLNSALHPMLNALANVVNSLPPFTGTLAGLICLGGLCFIVFRHFRRLAREWLDGDLATKGLIWSAAFTLLPAVCSCYWVQSFNLGKWLLVLVAVLLVVCAYPMFVRKRLIPMNSDRGFGESLMFSIGLMTLQFCLIGLTLVFLNLHSMAADGLDAPDWLSDYYWAKPALIFMAFWAAVGSNNMVLYIAGISNIPIELYEAADIDGATPLQKFWHITWPQLAPVTFFIVVMSVIAGLQGGFEMARTMTEGGPAGSTTTLSYFVYIEGFETGRLGYASAVVWTLFLLVFTITVFNFKFGNRYVND